jgi:hypothetical protein
MILFHSKVLPGATGKFSACDSGFATAPTNNLCGLPHSLLQGHPVRRYPEDLSKIKPNRY